MNTAEEVREFSEKGTISVQMENIFPIIKKWLYNDKEIFLRELISNGVDAISKVRHLMVIGEAEKASDDFQIQVKVNKEERTLTISDNGLGMTAEEIKQYINQVAFSSATSFVEKFKTAEAANEIIGHFGLGFYSAFTVADKVEINSRSYRSDAEAVLWSCDGSPEFHLGTGTRSERGTDIILHLSKDENEFLEDIRLKNLIRKYCDFLPYAIALNGEVANKQKPLWDRTPSEVTKEEYLAFYHYLYPFAQDPYLWIHLNVEVPFHLKGILYFPKLTHELDPSKGNIKLFCHNVYVSDHCEDFIPRFLITLQGAIDCPDIPLNVSRSMLQNDPYVKKVSDYITRKVADRLKEMHNKERDFYIESWKDIHVFIKVGMMEDEKFYDKMKDYVIFKTTNDDYVTIEQYLEKNRQGEECKVYYTTDDIGQASYLELFKKQGIDVLSMNTLIDTHFIQFLEFKNQKVKFARIDSDITDSLVEKDKGAQIVDPKTNKTTDELVLDIFKNHLSVPKLTVKVESLKSEDVPALLLFPETMRRLQEMTRFMQSGAKENDLLEEHTLVLNSNSPIIQNLKRLSQGIKPEDTLKLVCEHVYELAMLAHRPLKAERLEGFMKRSHKVLQLMTERS